MLHIIFYTIIAVLILSFFGVSLESIVHSPAAESNFSYLWNLVLTGWHLIVDFIMGIVVWIEHLFIH